MRPIKAVRRFAHGSADPDGVMRWRRTQLLDAGFPSALAAELADTPGIDLHALLSLVDLGCPPPLAARLLETPELPLRTE